MQSVVRLFIIISGLKHSLQFLVLIIYFIVCCITFLWLIVALSLIYLLSSLTICSISGLEYLTRNNNLPTPDLCTFFSSLDSNSPLEVNSVPGNTGRLSDIFSGSSNSSSRLYTRISYVIFIISPFLSILYLTYSFNSPLSLLSSLLISFSFDSIISSFFL